MAEGESTPKDDLVSLESLVDSGPGTAASADAPAAPAADPASAPAEAGVTATDTAPADASVVVDVDALIAEEDPEFAAAMSQIKADSEAKPPEGDVEIDPIDIEKITSAPKPSLKERLKQIRPPKPAELKAGIGIALGFVKHAVGQALKTVKKVVTVFKALPASRKVMVFGVLVFGVMALVTMRWVLSGSASLSLEPKFLRSFADIADAKFTYTPDEPMEEFTDPLFHPEHVVLIDHLVVNLRQPGDGRNPMGLFELYFEATNQESAVEIKDREGELRDVLSRALEQMTYEELSTIAGKEHFKVIARKNANNLLTRGQVRRIFIKTFILKP